MFPISFRKWLYFQNYRRLEEQPKEFPNVFHSDSPNVSSCRVSLVHLCSLSLNALGTLAFCRAPNILPNLLSKTKKRT